MGLMRILNVLSKPLFKIIIKHRWGYDEAEYRKAMELGLLEAVDMEAMTYWLVAEPVCSHHCSGCHNEGRPLYFNPMGMLIRHKCPPGVCIHGLSQLSPLIYDYYDHMLQGKDPNQMVFDHVTCTDAGLEMGGLGDNLFRLRREKMPLIEYARFMLTMLPFLFIKNRRARGECRAMEEAPTSGGPEPSDFMRTLPLQEDELEAFLASPKRARRLQSIERFKDHHIVIRVVSSRACIAGHKEGDEFHLDALGRVLRPEGNEGVCIMALTKIWWRVMLMMERMAAGTECASKLFDLPMNCYGAGLPLGACGEIMMRVELRKT
ncbi:MAG: hypothetical protein H5T74_05100 [Actinobacteria bacterium]|nr:hypothetical protein [Actinomycetota bacterium]